MLAGGLRNTATVTLARITSANAYRMNSFVSAIAIIKTITWKKTPSLVLLLWSPYVIGQTIIFSSCFFFLSFFFFFSSPNLSGRRLDVNYDTSAHGLSANLECRSEMHCARLAANTGRKISPSRHHRTTLAGHIFARKACIDNRKKILSSNISSTCSTIWWTSAH